MALFRVSLAVFFLHDNCSPRRIKKNKTVYTPFIEVWLPLPFCFLCCFLVAYFGRYLIYLYFIQRMLYFLNPAQRKSEHFSTIRDCVRFLQIAKRLSVSNKTQIFYIFQNAICFFTNQEIETQWNKES